jgi:hypothetical protein
MSCVPQLPPHLAENNNRLTPQEGDEDDAYGPALPPHLAAKKKTQQTQQPTRRSPSPIILTKTAPSKVSAPPVQEDSDSDDDFGPPPPAAGPLTTASNEDAVREFKEREQRRKELAEVSYLSKCILCFPGNYSLRRVLPSLVSSRPTLCFITLLEL